MNKPKSKISLVNSVMIVTMVITVAIAIIEVLIKLVTIVILILGFTEKILY